MTGKVIWFTGISGSGKTALTLGLKDRLASRGLSVEVLAGDIMRDFFENDLGHNRQERIHNVKRIVLAATLLAKSGRTVIVTNMAPYYEVRDFIRRKISNYIQIYLRCSVKKCIDRDVKGLYAKAKEGKVSNILGSDDKYDVPRKPDIIVDTDKNNPEECTDKIVSYLALVGFYNFKPKRKKIKR